jgi:glycosyltransferase involved in cell wall biosynthesis
VKISFLNPIGTIGGAERCLLDLLERLRESHTDWQLVVITSSGGPLVDEVRRLGVVCHVLPFPRSVARLGDADDALSPITLTRTVTALPASASYVLRLRQLLRAQAPDIVHSNGLKMHALGALAKPRNSKLVWHIHDYPSARPVMARVLRVLARRCDLAVANSKSVAADVEAVCRRKVNVTTIFNGVDLDHFTPLGPRLDLDRIGGVESPAGVVKVGLAATMAPWKGHEVFLRALARVPEELRVRGYVIGGAIYATDSRQTRTAELRRLADSLGLTERVVFTGFIEDIASAMRSLDILVHASTSPEPFGLVIVQAMACGKPVVVSCAGGAAEIVEGGTFGLCNAPGDVNKMSDNIEMLARDQKLRAAKGIAGRREAELRFDNRTYAAAFATAYDRLIRVPE